MSKPLYSQFKDGFYCGEHKLIFKDKCPKCAKRNKVSDGTHGTNEKLVKETAPNRVSGGRVGLVATDSIFYNPHNARFYFKFSKWSFKPSGEFSESNSGSELSIVFEGCRFVVKKESIEVTNKVDSKRLFPIQGSISERKELVSEAGKVLESECVYALRLFVSKFGGVAEFVPYKSWIPDNKVSHHPIVESIPKGSIWRDDVSKKVYPNEQNVEYSSPEYSQTAFRNLGILDVAPEIETRLDKIDSDLLVFRRDALEPLTAQIKLHLEVMSEMRDTMKNINSGIRQMNVKKLKDEWW